jgi:phosphoglycerate dehydrogenase-like enzyme
LKSVVLYLDKISGPMEQLLLDISPNSLQIKFLNPVIGEKGTIAEANYVLATNFLVTKEVIDAAPRLKMIQRTGVGYDNVDIEYARSKDIPVSITIGTNSSSVAELVILYMLALYRKLIVLDRQSKTGKWDSWKYRHESFELLGKTVGIIGAGAIGRELIKRLTPFGVKIIYYDVFRLTPEKETALGVEYRSMDGLLKEADIVTVHVPWIESTRGMIGKDELAKMKKNAIIINTARGPIVDEKALVNALNEGVIAGAAVDVFDPEPFTADSEILKFDNVITTPHVGAATLDNFSRVFTFCTANIGRVERGEKPENVVNGVI